ncbi:cytochrome P450 [Virgisporangium aurantiacum]|uniref:Cytochrome P450 n=1 Tax=Virgisporangium aurantiacum TaxID=175570 RepID=A0A8J3ZC11_9ACTN|nr:cytochrome P450 [Virgisporangium aurantiacum]GIJ61214.1 cytochrome P450 [Virgisporangium aurantiacum]
MADDVVGEILDWYRETAHAGLAGDGVRFVEPPGFWVVHGHADVNRVLTDHPVFSSDELRHSAQPVPHHENPLLHSLSAIDPPRHHLLRRLVSRAFTPRAIRSLLPSIADTVRAQLSDVDGELDVIGQLGVPVPVHTIAALLGVDADRQADFVRWAGAITSFAGSFTRDPVRRAAFRTAHAELAGYFRDVFAERRSRPRGDVIDTLLAAEPDGSRLSDEELLDFCTLLLINGHETTGTLLVNIALCLAAHPDALARLRADPGLVPGAVEEVLRFLPPTGGADRFTTGPTTIAGHAIGAGQRVVAMMVSANRDPRIFTDPDDFRPDRTPNEHLSFGHGVHFCLGAHLARHEAAIALRELLHRVPGTWSVSRIATRRTPVGIDVTDLALAGRRAVLQDPAI